MADGDATPTSTGLSDNAAGMLAYITPIPAIYFLVAEPYNRNPYIRFHAWQNIFLAIGWFACSIVAIIPILGWIVAILGDLALFVCWIMCLIKASSGQKFMVPFIGALAQKQADS